MAPNQDQLSGAGFRWPSSRSHGDTFCLSTRIRPCQSAGRSRSVRQQSALHQIPPNDSEHYFASFQPPLFPAPLSYEAQAPHKSTSRARIYSNPQSIWFHPGPNIFCLCPSCHSIFPSVLSAEPHPSFLEALEAGRRRRLELTVDNLHRLLGNGQELPQVLDGDSATVPQLLETQTGRGRSHAHSTPLQPSDSSSENRTPVPHRHDRPDQN